MSSKQFTKTAYDNLNDFIYGHAVHPTTLKNGMVIGGGTLYPEVNFTLPTMEVLKETMPEVIRHYHQIITGICQRCYELEHPGFVAEIELVPPCTENPEWGIEVCKTIVDVIKEYEAKHGVKGGVRITVNDIREGRKLEHMWHGWHWEQMMKTFEGSAKVGADLMSVESLGGKEIVDEGLMFCDIGKVLYGFSILGCTDMNKLWPAIVEIGKKTGAHAAGDTACGFANTGMVLAEKNYIPRVFGAAVRVMASVRSIIAYECGAVGPDKDCGYEGPYLKAISGRPISAEGRIACVAHLSRVGNISCCVTDLWSNESVQNIQLLGGMAPTISFEQLVYDCRLMNGAAAKGRDTAVLLRDLYADSDSKLDPHAYILRPDVVLDISKEMVKVNGYYPRMKKAAELAFDRMAKANAAGQLNLDEKEKTWLNKFQEDLAALPSTDGELIEQVKPETEAVDTTIMLKWYDM